MKKIIIAAIVVPIIVIIIWVYAQKAARADQLKPAILNFAFGKLSVASFQSLPLKITLGINNYSATQYNLEQVFAELYTEDGNTLLASQVAPLETITAIKGNTTTKLTTFDFNVSNLNVFNFLFSGNKSAALLAIGKAVLGDKLGKKVMLKGFIRAEGFKVNLAEIIEI